MNAKWNLHENGPILIKTKVWPWTPSPLTFEIIILSYGLEVMAWKCTHNLRVVLCTCTQCCPREAPEQKMDKKPTAKQKEFIERLVFNTFRFVSTRWSFWWFRTLKSDEKWPSYVHSKLGQWWRLLAYFGLKICY